MKNITILFSILITGILSAQGIHFDKSKYKELLSKAKKENKLVFIDAYASWCGPCKKMAKFIFTNKEVGDYYNSNFINAKIDMEKGEGKTIAKKYRIFSYPTYLFIDGDGKVIYQNRGYKNKTDFITIGKEAQNVFGDNGTLKKLFDNGDEKPETLAKIIEMYAVTDYPLAKKASEKYFKNKKDNFTAKEINYLIPFIRSKNGSNFNYFIANKSEIIKHLPIENYNLVRQQILVSDVLVRHTDEKHNKIINENAALNELIDILGKEKAENLFNRYLLSIYQSTDTDKFIKTALTYYKDQKNFNPKEIMQASWIIAENTKDENAITTASQWMERLVMTQENSENTFILAKLYYLLGKKTEAKMFAKASIDLAKGKKMILAEQLLEKLK